MSPIDRSSFLLLGVLTACFEAEARPQAITEMFGLASCRLVGVFTLNTELIYWQAESVRLYRETRAFEFKSGVCRGHREIVE